ncbi:hypothetical protein ABZ826_37745 [Streptomyces sp. NPDC047515]|uniref:hypothetical protein n=1 Tax=Streptomyces sp. NPDC047515 TaxID=3155380 RepID=UPI0033C32FBE
MAAGHAAHQDQDTVVGLAQADPERGLSSSDYVYVWADVVRRWTQCWAGKS